MRHLRLVPLPAPAPPERTLAAVTAVDGPHDLPVPAPDLADMFARTDQLMAGLSREQKLAVARTLYYDADGNPAARSLNLRLL